MRKFRSELVPVPPDFRPFALRAGVPLDVEIGCGVGFHPLHYARAHPDRQLIAFERTSEKFAKFVNRLEHHAPLPNLLPVHGDAIPWITHGLSAEMVDQYFVLYPNPYPKERQRNQRFYEMPFMHWLVETLKRGGTLTLATNQEFYCTGAKEKLGEFGLELVKEERVHPSEVPRTHFEKKYLARGEPCWNLVFQRPKA